jgi:proprotein convertase subtilisin/kexin type 5
LYSGSCFAVCPSGTVADRTSFKCVACNTPCRTCNNHPSSCTSCEPGEGYLQITESTQSCVKSCAEGTFPKNNVCEVCNFKCAKCLGSADNCIACPAGRFLYNGACWDFCPGVTVNDQCIDSCPAGFYRFSDRECRECNSQCETCDNNQTCLTCKNNFVSRNGTCVAECGAGFYSFRGFCVGCNPSCGTCANTPNQCLTCAAGFVRSGSRCVSRCEDGSYLDSATNTCQSCSSTCLTCSSENLCTSCPNVAIVPVGGQCLSCIYPCNTCSADLSTCFTCLSGFSLSNGQCVRTCPTGSRSVNGVCTCASGIFLDGVCVDSCPSGFTSVRGTCQRCVSPCASCTGNSVSFCTDCLDTFILNPNTGVCEQTSACNFGQEEVNGQCERICDANYFFQDGACIFGGCPTDFKDNGFGGCVVSSTNTNRCEIPTFRLNGICISDCGNKFFPDSSSRTCRACSSNCETCLSQRFCFACATGFTSVDGRCVPQSECPSAQLSYNGNCVNRCPSGTYTENGICIRSCPAGSFYYDRFCYNTCPLAAPLSTENVCVTTCPTGTVQIDGVCATIV